MTSHTDTPRTGIDAAIKVLSAPDWNPETMMFYNITETERTNILETLREISALTAQLAEAKN